MHRLLGQCGHLKLKFSFLGPLPPILLAFPFHFIKELESFINTLYILENHGILKLEEILDIKSVPSFYRQESSDSDTLKLIQILHLVSGKGWNKTQVFHHAASCSIHSIRDFQNCLITQITVGPCEKYTAQVFSRDSESVVITFPGDP